MKIEFESKKKVVVCRIFGKINEKSVGKLFESFEKTAKESLVLIVLDKVSEIDGAGFVAFHEISTFVKKSFFTASLPISSYKEYWN